MTARSLWLDRLVCRWPVGRLKDHVSLVNGFPFDSQSFNDSRGTRLVRIRDLANGAEATYVDAAVPAAAMIDSGDLIVGMDGDFSVVTWNSGPAALNQRLCVLRSRPTLDQRFLGYLLPTPLKAINDVTYFTTVKHLSSFELLDERIPLPPLDTQMAIADFLDRETARIDALIAAKRRMMRLLEERDTSLIHEFTTRGVCGASLADSGIPWLGSIPVHWQVMQIRRLCRVRRGASPRPIDDPIYFDEHGEYGWVRIEDVTRSGRHLKETTQRLSDLGSSLSAKLAPGALFVSIAGSVGKPSIALIKCCVHDGFVYFDQLAMRPAFLYYLFEAQQLFQGLGKLGTQLNLNTEIVGSIEIPVPPPEEQDEIVKQLDARLKQGALTRAAYGRSLELLLERRTALINAAVTGDDSPSGP